MNPSDPPPVGIDQVVAAQMMVIQQMVNIVTEIQNQIRQERQEIRQDLLEIRQEIRQTRWSHFPASRCRALRVSVRLLLTEGARVAAP
jgi:hypothetical protein